MCYGAVKRRRTKQSKGTAAQGLARNGNGFAWGGDELRRGNAELICEVKDKHSVDMLWKGKEQNSNGIA